MRIDLSLFPNLTVGILHIKQTKAWMQPRVLMILILQS